MLKNFALALLLIVLGFAAYVALQPSVATISRSAVIAAPPAAVFANINDLHKWQDWSPWAKLDPDAKASFEGPQSGTGAAFEWSGNSDIGEGSMTITDSKPDERVKLKLEFKKPFASESVAEFDLKPDGAGTNVTWSMTGERPFLARAICIILNGDRMVGRMFEKGLDNLGKVSSGISGS